VNIRPVDRRDKRAMQRVDATVGNPVGFVFDGFDAAGPLKQRGRTRANQVELAAGINRQLE